MDLDSKMRAVASARADSHFPNLPSGSQVVQNLMKVVFSMPAATFVTAVGCPLVVQSLSVGRLFGRVGFYQPASSQPFAPTDKDYEAKLAWEDDRSSQT